MCNEKKKRFFTFLSRGRELYMLLAEHKKLIVIIRYTYDTLLVGIYLIEMLLSYKPSNNISIWIHESHPKIGNKNYAYTHVKVLRMLNWKIN